MRFKYHETWMGKFEQHFGKKINEYPSFQKAIRPLAKSTTHNYATLIPRFCLYMNQTPDEIITNRKQHLQEDNEFYEAEVTAFVKEMEKQNLQGKPIINILQGFFTNNSKRLSLDLRKLKTTDENKNIKYSASVDETKKLLAHADCARDKLLITMIFQNGILPVDLANLRIGDYPSKPWVYYKQKRSKTGKYWKSASTPDICCFMEEYLLKRKGKVGDPLFVGREGVLSRGSISEIVDRLIIAAGFKSINGFCPKCLRDGFNDALIDAKVGHEVKEALMGHNADKIYHKYGGEVKVAERVVEAMRKVYPLICLTDQPTLGSTEAELKSLKEIIAMLPALKKLIEQQET